MNFEGIRTSTNEGTKEVNHCFYAAIIVLYRAQGTMMYEKGVESTIFMNLRYNSICLKPVVVASASPYRLSVYRHET